MEDPGLIALISVLLAGSVFLLTLINTNAAITLLIFSMLLSPEIPLAQVPGRSVVVRFDDFLLGVVFFTWLAKLAINKQFGLIRSTPLNVPVGVFILLCLVSTALGIIQGSVAKPASSFFYLVKYVEYFVLYFMTANVLRHPRQVERFLTFMVVTLVIVGLYGYWQAVTYGAGYRISAPFEGAQPEPNTLAGYLVLMMGVCGGLALYTHSVLQRVFFIGAIAWSLPPLIFTYSRGGYAAFIVMYLILCVFSRRHKLVLWSLLLLGVFLAPSVLPHTVFERLASTFDPRGAIEVGGRRLQASAAQRLIVWGWIFEKWQEHPFFGFGITGLGVIVDQQYALVIGELGIVGFLVYLWVRWRIGVSSYRTFRTVNTPLAQGLGLGFLAGFAGLLVHSFAGNIFIIVRIMEPFWFLAAMVMKLPEITAQESLPTHKST